MKTLTPTKLKTLLNNQNVFNKLSLVSDSLTDELKTRSGFTKSELQLIEKFESLITNKMSSLMNESINLIK